MRQIVLLLMVSISCFIMSGQKSISETGLWNQYFINTDIGNRLKVAIDFQYRSYEIPNDFQQFIGRAAIGYQPKGTQIKLYTGYGYFNSGARGQSDATSYEHRLHQDIWWDSEVSDFFEIKHRIRIEERFVENQDFRTRFRYMLFVNVPFNNRQIINKTYYLALWNETFINGQTSTGISNVEYFDRNWSYAGIGYKFNETFKFQAGYMHEFTPSIKKGQFVLSVFQNI
ncbi:hypothetical protein BST92_14025 [Nonlabens arenilitoris]|uniref:DUF2490 domain-containing protein n=1 Tax=Nonlabens arenilitoris TaxID=1217969 RepID=A0A2S7UDL2_9FLAO|nr:DUF2490 domain-containing protein [Nonlabens arenilitoris]PQJ32969.1 hypothetical protein BST92_14025 [Nonlabens arenilitoris]